MKELLKKFWTKIKTNFGKVAAGAAAGAAIIIAVNAEGNIEITVEGTTIEVTDSLKYALLDSADVDRLDSLIDADEAAAVEFMIDAYEDQWCWVMATKKGDVVGIFPGHHDFSTAEKQSFSIKKALVRRDSMATLQGDSKPDMSGLSEAQKDSIDELGKPAFKLNDTTSADLSKWIKWGLTK